MPSSPPILVCAAHLLLAVGCARDPTHAICPAEIRPTPSPAPDCRISGDGNLDWQHSFALYRGPADPEPVAIVHHPDRVAVAWTEFPPPSADEKTRRSRRARVELGDQDLLRFTGWAALDQIAFQLRSRVDINPGHLWLRAGAPVEILGWQHGELHIAAHYLADARGPTRTRTRCDDLVYTNNTAPTTPDDRPSSLGARLYPTVDDLPLAAAPDGCTVTQLHTRFGIDLHEIERRGDWVHVAGGEHVAFDGWVRAAHVQRTPVKFDRDFITNPDDHDSCAIAANVDHDAPVRVGTAPRGSAIGQAEVRAAILLRGAPGGVTADDGAAWVAFEFSSRAIVAPERQSFWIRRTDITLDDSSGCPDDPPAR